MSGWSTLRMTILAARRVLPPDLMTPAKASKPRMKLSGPEAVPPPREGLHATADVLQVRACARSPLEEHALGLGQGEDRVERVLHRVDEAGRALGLGVAGDGELDRARVRVPVPVLRVGVGLEAVAADVEPDGRVERDLLIQKKVGELGVEGLGVVGVAK